MSDAERNQESDLWTFTLNHYQKPGVQHAVIALQDNQGADVNILFFCLWCAMTGRPALDTAVIEKADGRIARWRAEVTLPLRRLRDFIKADSELCDLTGAMDTRGKIIGAEIESERVAQLQLISVAPATGETGNNDVAAIAEANLLTYFRYMKREVSAEARTNLDVLLNALVST